MPKLHDMQSAVGAVKGRKLTIRQVAREFDIKHKTPSDHVKRNVASERRETPRMISDEDENYVVQYMPYMPSHIFSRQEFSFTYVRSTLGEIQWI
jgi:hypothetical protein